jgi:hypothetical protein
VFGAALNHIALTLTTIGLLAGWHEEAERRCASRPTRMA